MVPMPPPQQPFAPTQQDGMYGWNGSVEGNGFMGANQPNGFSMMSPPAQYGQPVQPVTPASNALARRQNNRALVHPGMRSQFGPGVETWGGLPDDAPAFLPQPPQTGPLDETDSIERLEERAARAKREAQTKRKQIPPFVQKLSRYVVLLLCPVALMLIPPAVSLTRTGIPTSSVGPRKGTPSLCLTRTNLPNP